MAQISFPKLPCAKLGIVKNKRGSYYYYVQTYTHHYDREKKRSVRDSQKTIGTVTGGEKYGVIKFKQFFLDEHPELENFITYWTKDGFQFKVADEEEFSAVVDKPIEKKLAGASWALQSLMGQIGFGDALRECFSSYKRHLKLASLAIYMVLKRTNAMHYYEPFSKITWLPWSRSLNDAQITRLFQSITHDDVMRFFNALNRGYYQKYGDAFYNRVFVALDSTSISTQSQCLSQAEFGHNKDGDNIPQINYLLVCDEALGLPIYAKTYKGNVVDVSTVKLLLSELKLMYSKIKAKDEFNPELIFVTDRGYDSEDNLQQFLQHDYGFVMRSRLRSTWVKDLVDENYEKLMDDNSLDLYSNQHMQSTSAEYKYDDYPVNGKNKSNKASAKVHVHMYYDEQIKANNRSIIKNNTANARDAYNALVKKLYAKNKEVSADMLAEVKLDRANQLFIDSYCVLDDQGYAKISSQLIDERVRYSGIMVLLSNSIDDPKEAYFAYQRRRTVESNFQVFKSNLKFNRVFSSTDAAFQGKFLCQLLAASLMMILNARIKEYEKTPEAFKDHIKLSDRSLSRILDDLNTIMLTQFKGGYYFDVIGGKYNTLYKALGISVPEAKHRYEPDKDDIITDEDLYAEDEYEKPSAELEAMSGEEY